MDSSRRHRFLWRLVWWPIRLYMRLRLNYLPKVHPLPAPCLIVSNHCIDIDPLLLALTVKNPTYFIASEHLFRNPRIAKLLIWAQAPIARMKGTTGGDTALTAVRRLRAGHSVALFPEGNRTFNGRTGDIVESTAKLARISGASLATHKFRGGYFTNPRWAGGNLRRGRMTGEIVHVYSPEELRAMTPAQIADVIRADIYEDAYATQAEWHVPYKGKHLAENLERALCLCPKCRGMSTLQSRDDTLTCTACGLTARFTPLGYLEGEGLPFRTVTEWDVWQAGELKTMVDAAGDKLIAEDDDTDLYEVADDDYAETPLGHGKLRIFRDRLECAGRRLPISEISGMAINGPQSLVLTSKNRHYCLKSRRVRNLRKYVTIYHALTAPDKILAI